MLLWRGNQNILSLEPLAWANKGQKTSPKCLLLQPFHQHPHSGLFQSVHSAPDPSSLTCFAQTQVSEVRTVRASKHINSNVLFAKCMYVCR